MAKIKSSRRATSASSRAPYRKVRSATSTALYSDILGIAGSLLRNRQKAGADKITALAGATRTFADDLTDSPNIQSYAHAAAEQMESLGDYVSETGMQQVVDDAMDLARRHPVSTIAFAVAVGFAFTRLMTHEDSTQRAAQPKSPAKSTRRAKVVADTSKPRKQRKTKPNGRDTAYERSNAA